MITYFDRQTSKDTLVISDNLKKNSWIFVEDPSPEELDYLVNKLGLDKGLVSDAIDVDEAPRLDIEEGNLYVFCRFAYKDSYSIKTSPVMFCITKDHIIAISVKTKSVFKTYAEENKAYITKNKMDILTNLLKSSIDSYSYSLNYVNRQIRSIRSNLNVDKLSNKDFIKLVEVGDVLNEFIGDIVPLSNVLQTLEKNKQTTKFTEDELDLLEDMHLSANQLLDNSKSALKTIVNIRESYSNIATNNLNKKITLLTTLTVVLTVPMIVASFWGMNVNVPFSSGKDSFLIIISATLLIVCITLIWLKTRKWF
jgi:magnesium transporter